jgi:predicted DNA binding CopG/RHH family protein
MKIDADEKELLESVDRGEWKSAGGGKRERTRFSRYARGTFKKDRRLNIRLSSKDLEAIQKRALAEGLPYQTLIASLLHKYAAGRLKETALAFPDGCQAYPAVCSDLGEKRLTHSRLIPL